MSTWRGSVTDEYFVISFIRGVLSISLNERECNLDNNVCHYAVSDGLFASSKEKTNLMEVMGDYVKTSHDKEQNEISFTDVMAILDWKYDEHAKIYYDNLADEA